MRNKTIFVCQNCGYQSPRWLGRCPDCSSWNSLVEEIEPQEARLRYGIITSQEGPVSLSEVEVNEDQRIKTGIGELDRILGGGIVAGSVILIGGDPGIGKSTLSLQASNSLSRNGFLVLYVSGEESVRQTKLRANRLGNSFKNLYIVSQTDLNLIMEYIQRLKPRVVIIDSIQVLYKPELASSPGSVSQVRECAANLTFLAKSTGISVFLIGHVTKEGTLAGPRVLEHIVDTVLYFEGEQRNIYRILRAVKNRFGSTNEIGVFEMTGWGLREIPNPSDLFLSERPRGVSGSIVVPTVEGSRPLLIEIQALVSNSNFRMPRRRTAGLDYNRISLLIAVLEKRAGLKLQNQDIFVNVAGGVKILEPAADLGAAIAIASSFKENPTRDTDMALGEVGLSGEVRSVSQANIRCMEAQRLGFKRAILPKGNLANLEFKGEMELVGVKTINEALEVALSH
jgi:DNA repair protein RadA/Sms